MSDNLCLKILGMFGVIAYMSMLGIVLHDTFGTQGSVMLIVCYMVFLYKLMRGPHQ